MDDLPLGKIPITLLKIDVERYEKLVLREGLRHSRAYPIYTLKLMLGSSHDTGTRVFNCELLREHGFQVYRFQGGRYLAPIPLDFESSRCENFIAIKDYQDFHKRTISGIFDILFKSLRDAAWIRYIGCSLHR